MTIENTLSTAFWQALETQAHDRGHPLTPFNRTVAQTVLEAGLLAYNDRLMGIRRHRVVSAPTGSGKSSYAIALISALIRADSSSSAVFLCETIDQCEDTYQELLKLIDPNDLAVWTSAHDATKEVDEVETEYGFTPSAQFLVEDLRHRRVVVVTHSFYRGPRGYAARTHGDTERTLTIIDERPQEVSIFDIDQGDVAKARDWAVTQFGNDSHAVEALRQLHEYLGEVWELERPSGTNYRALRRADLEWFNSSEAYDILREQSDAVTCSVISFAQAMSNGYAFMSRYEGSTRGGRFVGYRMDLPVFPGTILLDATSDIDGVSQIAPWRSPVASPRVSFENLTVTHLTPPSDVIDPRERVSQIVKSARRARPYARWIKETIVRHTRPSEKVLVVVHQALLDHEYLPNKDSLGEDAFELEGRKVAFINWGYGIGSNRWKEATSVFLFGEFHIPKRATVAQVLGLLDQPAGVPDLSRMQSPNSQHEVLLALQTGHLLRWEKQLAMRGNARNISGDGVCGEQRLFVTSEFARFVKHRDRLFPSAKFVVDPSDRSTLAAKRGVTALAALLMSYDQDSITSIEVKERTGVSLQKHSARLLADALVQTAMADGGWVYVPGGGRGNPSRFQRITSHIALNDNKAAGLTYAA